jgi:transcriptional regulator with XRE-family HTH domain
MSKLKQYFDSQGIRQVDICNILGKSKAQISNYLTGKVPFGKKAAKEWSNAFGLSESWLLTGEGEMLRKNAPQPTVQQNNHHSPGARMENNYYMRGGAEGGNIAAQNLEVKSASEDARPIIPSYMYNMPDYDIYANIKNGAANMEIFSVEGFMKQIDIIYRVQDNSMTPSFTSGDLIGIRRLPETEHIVNGDYYVIDTKPHGVRLRILIENADSYTLRTTDANRDRYTDFNVAKSKIISIFAVVFLFRHSFV